MNDRDLFNKIAKFIPENYISIEKEDLIAYSRDQTSPLLGTYMPRAVVMPGSTEEIQEIMHLSNDLKIAINPYITGALGGQM